MSFHLEFLNVQSDILAIFENHGFLTRIQNKFLCACILLRYAFQHNSLAKDTIFGKLIIVSFCSQSVREVLISTLVIFVAVLCYFFIILSGISNFVSTSCIKNLGVGLLAQIGVPI